MVKVDPSDASLTDASLLADWLESHSEAAFHALVDRYGGLVQMAALRTCGDASLAGEVSQLTFITLVSKARSLRSRTSLAGWLHLTAVMHAKNQLRHHQRETRKLELLRTHMETHVQGDPADTWRQIRPVLDGALAALSAKDREALLLRFYLSLSVRELAARLGIAKDAAQKRLDRALERLRRQLTRRGCETAGSISLALAAGLGADAHAAVPASTILAAKALASSTVAGGIFTSSIITIVMTQKTMIAGAAALIFVGAVSIALIHSTSSDSATGGNKVAGSTERSPTPTTASSVTLEPVSRSSRVRRVADHPELVAKYGDSRTKLSKTISTRVIGLLEDGNVMREMAISGKMPSPFGGNSGMKISQGHLGDDLRLTPEQQAGAAASYAEFQRRELASSKESIDRLKQDPTALMQLMLVSDALARGEIARDEYEQIQAASSLSLKGIENPLEQKIFGADPPLRDEVFIGELKSILDQEQIETLQALIDESAAKNSRDASRGTDISNLPLMELEKLDQTIASAKKMAEGFKSLFEGMGDMKKIEPAPGSAP